MKQQQTALQTGEKGKSRHDVRQRWANYGLRAARSPPEYMMRPYVDIKITVNIKM